MAAFADAPCNDRVYIDLLFITYSIIATKVGGFNSSETECCHFLETISFQSIMCWRELPFIFFKQTSLLIKVLISAAVARYLSAEQGFIFPNFHWQMSSSWGLWLIQPLLLLSEFHLIDLKTEQLPFIGGRGIRIDVKKAKTACISGNGKHTKYTGNVSS